LLHIVHKRISLDRLAIGLSGLCVAHCLITAVLLTAMSSLGGVLLHPVVHEAGLGMAIALAGLALGRGFLAHGYVMPVWVGTFGLGVMLGALTLDHGWQETIFSIIGVLIVALGHDLNRRAVVPYFQ
jgi:hypothetical protein